MSIIDKTIAAVKIPRPDGGKCILSSNDLTSGATVKSPQKPYTTDGIAARISIMFLNVDAMVPLGKYSPKKMAAASDKGAEIVNARNEVRSVPIKKGSIPKCSLTGSHVLPHKKEMPLALMAGQEDIVNVRKNARMRITDIRAEKLNHLTNILFSSILRLFIVAVLLQEYYFNVN